MALTQSKEIKVLRQIVDITNSELSLKRTLKEVVDIVNDIAEADSVFIYLLDSVQKAFILAASKTPHKKELGNLKLNAGEGITGWVAKESKPVAIKKDAYKDSRFKSFDVLPEDKYEAFLSVPIVYKKKAVGVINVQHKSSQSYSSSTTRLITTIAKQVSGAIVNSSLYDEAKQKALQFDSLIKVSSSVTSENYLDEILNLIVVVTAEMLNSKICSIMILDKKGKELIIKATQSLSAAYKKKPNIKVANSISGDVLTKRKPIAVYDVQKEDRYGFKDLAIKEKLTSMLAVPMIMKDKAIGVINVYTNEVHEFTKEEMNALQIIANQAAIAIENTNLVEDVLRAKEALETRKMIERAKGILMKMNNIGENEAYRLINKKSMDSAKPMKEIAESILLMEEFM